MPDEPCDPSAPKLAGDSHRFWWTVATGVSGAATVLAFIAPATGPAGFWVKAVALTLTAVATTIKAHYDFKGGGRVTVQSLSDLVPTRLKRSGNGGPPLAPQP